ncbi:hypothetical protein EV667_0561 [Ancylobacter aquaticus]|uniref:DUF1284 domain-containing protein n=1 Tax=Ancylobacter aquaticus TaxID=100 RepID=A0A4R1I8H3_ANCAQ|nr:DUF1284 domain-containing protein [Ancylobacter aquaticus]TCK30471.1 hypothetical protein EV667_0561 [Ancylobacter aquaticus]
MTVRLRAHHLLCLLTFVGKGYTPAFAANYRRIVARLDAGEAVELVEGPDDICAPMLGEPEHHCRNASVAMRDVQARAAIAKLLGRPLEAGRAIALTVERVERMRRGFAEGGIRAACTGCQWSAFCTQVAGQGFAGTRLTGTVFSPSAGCGTPG